MQLVPKDHDVINGDFQSLLNYILFCFLSQSMDPIFFRGLHIESILAKRRI